MTALSHSITKNAGIVRNAHDLENALRVINCIERQVEPIWKRRRWSPDLMDMRDLLVVGRSIAESALSEPKSVGAHYLEDELNARPTHAMGEKRSVVPVRGSHMTTVSPRPCR